MWRRVGRCIATLIILAMVPACGDDVAEDIPFTLTVSPEFVQGVIPGTVTGVLVTIGNESPTDEPVTITAAAEGATVTVEPSAIVAGEVAEVTIVAAAVTEERPIDIVVVGTRGDRESTVTRSTTVMAWEDDRGDDADALLSVFLGWLEEHRPELGIGTGTDFSGSLVAPGLLVVSHYMYLTDDWEIGLSWHVMIPPDDWSEIYLRPRHGPVPTLAFRLTSQAGALQDGVIDIMEVMPPTEVVR